ncbi:MAG: methylated-DNA--[protein]-cysteine S-methyltransferase [SAR202 cluster bacterium]|nr:methylated-DNA--[protein]-cysteine S-methyltransferase [SAR202 cluster bacterium]
MGSNQSDRPGLLPDSDTMWAAVQTKDETYLDAFVQGVSSTGIYCRPTCPSRTPKRTNLTFYKTWQEAEAGGFRACKRCLPSTPHSRHPHVLLAEQVCRLIEAAVDRPPTLSELGAAVGRSSGHVHQVFRAVMGTTPSRYAESLKFDDLKSALKTGPSVTDAIYEAGFGSPRRVYERAKDQLGMTPAEYRKGAYESTIGYQVIGCSLGFLLVAATEKGICSVRLGDTEAELRDGLATEFPGARLESGSPAAARVAAEIVGYIDSHRTAIDAVLDVGGTRFQRLVWDRLTRIPVGETASYGAVAADIGSPDGARAVAGACAANPVAILIPCHRVTRSDGEPGGYRWGAERKQALLALERETNYGPQHPGQAGSIMTSLP